MKEYRKPEIEFEALISDIITTSTYDVFEGIADSDSSKTIRFSDELVEW